MTTRYSGDLAITVTYRDRPDDYRVTLSWPNRSEGRTKTHRHTVYVGRLPTQSVDDPKTIDSVAHAAISFASEEEGEVGENAANDLHGWHVGRTKKKAWATDLPEAGLTERVRP